MITNTLDLKNTDTAFTFHQLLTSLDPYDKAEVWYHREWSALCTWYRPTTMLNVSSNQILTKRDKNRLKPVIKATKISILYNNIALYDRKVRSVHIIGAFSKRLAIVLYDAIKPVTEGYQVIEEITKEEWAALDDELEKYETSSIPYNVNENKILSFILHLIEKDTANYDKMPFFIQNDPLFRRLAIQYNPKLIPTLFPKEYSNMIEKGK